MRQEGVIMKTQVKPVSPQAIAEAAKLIAGGELVGMPTETVYGLGANALDETAEKDIRSEGEAGR